MKVLITGAAGVVGSALSARLLREGIGVRGLDLEDGSRLPAEVDFHRGDACDPRTLEQALEGVEGVFHCAGVVSFSQADAARQQRVHVEGAQLLVAAIQRANAGRLVYVSSVGSLGPRASSDPLDERADVREGPVLTRYGVTKRQGELHVQEAVAAGVVDAVIVLPSGIFGPEFHPLQRRTLVTPFLMGLVPRLFAGGFNCVTLDDVVEGCLLAWRHGKAGHRYILGGENLPFQTLVKAITEPAGVRAPARAWSEREARWVDRLIAMAEQVAMRLGVPTDASIDAFRSNQLYLYTRQDKAESELGYRSHPVRPVIADAIRRVLAKDAASRWVTRVRGLRPQP